MFYEDFGPPAISEMLQLMLGERIGRGQFREVFACEFDASIVIKIEDRCQSFSNIREWDIWGAIRETEHAKWFAPCLRIGQVGISLIQKRTKPVTMDELRDELPRVPAFFTDLKVGNWGRLDGRIVCHDYGNHLLYERGMTKAMKKADWWE